MLASTKHKLLTVTGTESGRHMFVILLALHVAGSIFRIKNTIAKSSEVRTSQEFTTAALGYVLGQLVVNV